MDLGEPVREGEAPAPVKAPLETPAPDREEETVGV